jgi:hypothetical protein
MVILTALQVLDPAARMLSTFMQSTVPLPTGARVTMHPKEI